MAQTLGVKGRDADKAVDAVATSIREFGFRVPLVVDEAGVIICGHTRWKAALKLGLREVPVHVATGLTPAQAAGLRLADNQVSSLAEWNLDLLQIELTELQGAGVDLGSLGFSGAELEKLLGHPDHPDADETPPVPKVAFSKPGDLWLMDDHRLLCGDSTEAEDVARVMDGKKAALVATDPPYLVDYTGERPNDSGKDWSGVYHEVDIQDAGRFFRDVFTRILEVLAPHAAIYCWHAHKRQAEIVSVWNALGILDHQQIIWVKPTPVFGRVFWHFQHEPCLMGWKKGSIPPHDGDQSVSSVWEVDWEGKQRIVGNEHPTQKPVELFARPMRKHTRPGDVCFEPFSGSGSQIAAGTLLNRKVYGIEVEPVFVDLGVIRWRNLTGKTPRLERDGRLLEWPEIQAAGFGASGGGDGGVSASEATTPPPADAGVPAEVGS